MTKKNFHICIIIGVVLVLIGILIFNPTYKPEDPSKGKLDAPIIMTWYSDYQDPFNRNFYDRTFSKIDEKYIATGKLRVIVKDFALEALDPQAKKAAEAVNCAYEQDVYWKYIDLLFKNQKEWTNLKSLDVIEKLKQYSTMVTGEKIDTLTFDGCLDSGKYTTEIGEDIKEGKEEGVGGIPTFFISDGLEVKTVIGAHPFSKFEQIIEEMLSNR